MRDSWDIEAQSMFPLAPLETACKQYARYIAARTDMAQRALLLIQKDSKFQYIKSINTHAEPPQRRLI